MPRAVELFRQIRIENFVYQTALAAAGNSRNDVEHAQGYVHVEIFQIVFARAPDTEKFARSLPTRFGYGYFFRTGQILPGNGARARHNFARCARSDDFSAVHSRARPHVHDKIGGADCVLVVLDDNQSVSQISQMQQGVDELFVVPLMKSYARLVKDVQHSHKPAADLRGKPYSLRLASRKRAGRTRKRKIVQPHVFQKFETGVYFLQHHAGDERLCFVKAQIFKESGALLDAHLRQLINVFAADFYRQHFLFESLSVTGRALPVHHIVFVLPSDRIACRLVVATLQRRDKPVPKLCVLPLEAARLILYRERLSVVSPQQDTHDFVGKIFDRSVKVKAVALSQGLEIKLHDSAPNGLLKENILGSNSSSVTPQSGQDSFSEYIVSESSVLTTTSPSANLSAVSRLS